MGQSGGRCTFAIGGTVVLVSSGGPPDAEYALFDGGDIELRATGPGAIREVGYGTTVEQAKARLAHAGITADLARAAVAGARTRVAKGYARGAAVRAVVDRLEAAELLEAREFDAARAAYEGTWLDLTGLATDLRSPRAAATLRALHLAASLAEAADGDAVYLDTSELTSLRRPGERTYRRVMFDDAQLLVESIASLQVPRGRAAPSEATRAEVVEWLRERARAAPDEKGRLDALEAQLWSRDAPARGPLAETALWNIETKLARGETTGVLEQIDALERRRGRVPGTIYLRARAALATKAEEPKAVAERVSDLSTSMSAFHELQLLAAQSWLAAGDARRARAFARDLVENAGADDVLRMHAQAVLEAAGESSSANIVPVPSGVAGPATPPVVPPAPHSSGAVLPLPAVVLPLPAVQGGTSPYVARVGSSTPAAPTPAETPSTRSEAPTPRSPIATSDLEIPRPPLAPSGLGIAAVATMGTAATQPAGRTTTRPGIVAPSRPSAHTRTLPPGTTLPPYRVEPRGERVWSLPPPAEAEHERAESLSLPDGLRGEPPSSDEPPRNPPAARLACTYYARELARELRTRFGVELRTDVDGLEMAQRYLRELLVDGRVRTPAEHREVMRHGGFLSELLARSLSARWVDLESPEPGRWAMLLPSKSRPDEVARIWPFARVLRFVAMGHKERDLVSYYLELEARAR
ncbi:MAG TPA: hypothetical protein VGG39_13770 [Polyangiaceae bacterium]|jgi:hypothetical protein